MMTSLSPSSLLKLNITWFTIYYSHTHTFLNENPLFERLNAANDSDWMDSSYDDKERNVSKRIIPNRWKCTCVILEGNIIDYVLGDDFFLSSHSMDAIIGVAPSSKLDFFLTEIDRFHYECQFYSAHKHILFLRKWWNAFTKPSCQLLMSNKEFKRWICVIKCAQCFRVEHQINVTVRIGVVSLRFI